jgi:hypothetical protein
MERLPLRLLHPLVQGNHTSRLTPPILEWLKCSDNIRNRRKKAFFNEIVLPFSTCGYDSLFQGKVDLCAIRHAADS